MLPPVDAQAGAKTHQVGYLSTLAVITGGCCARRRARSQGQRRTSAQGQRQASVQVQRRERHLGDNRPHHWGPRRRRAHPPPTVPASTNHTMLHVHNVRAMDVDTPWPFLRPTHPRCAHVRPMPQKELLDLMGNHAGWLMFEDTDLAAGFPQPPEEEDARWPYELPPLHVVIVAISQEELLQLVAGSHSANL